jgi:hypothetical protein
MPDVPSIDENGAAAVAWTEAGARGVGEYRCCSCGYGIVTLSILPACPMCHGASWAAIRSPFAPRAGHDPASSLTSSPAE